MTMETFTFANGISPLAGDDGSEHLAQAYSLLSLLGAAWEDASAVDHRGALKGAPSPNGSELLACTPAIVCSAFDGIQTLIALGAFRMGGSHDGQ